jgi:hypothetical protein
VPRSATEGEGGYWFFCGVDDVEDHAEDEVGAFFLHGAAGVDDGLLGLRLRISQPC